MHFHGLGDTARRRQPYTFGQRIASLVLRSAVVTFGVAGLEQRVVEENFLRRLGSQLWTLRSRRFFPDKHIRQRVVVFVRLRPI